jgi:hypothetical protein
VSVFHQLKNYISCKTKRIYKSKSSANKILSEEAFRLVLDRERERVGRNQHQYSLILLDLGSTDKNFSNISRILNIITLRVRSVDELGWYDKQRIGIILPYTSADGACKLAENLCSIFEDELPKLRFDVFTYPLSQNKLSGKFSEKIFTRK